VVVVEIFGLSGMDETKEWFPRFCGGCGSPEIFILGYAYVCEDCGYGRGFGSSLNSKR